MATYGEYWYTFRGGSSVKILFVVWKGLYCVRKYFVCQMFVFIINLKGPGCPWYERMSLFYKGDNLWLPFGFLAHQVFLWKGAYSKKKKKKKKKKNTLWTPFPLCDKGSTRNWKNFLPLKKGKLLRLLGANSFLCYIRTFYISSRLVFSQGS